ncbi:post-GPI attachment to proteins factor 2-like isoform X2 [Antedon mediterranea]
MGVALHITPRLLFATVYYNYYGDMKHVVETKRKGFVLCNRVGYVSHICEIFCLLGLTCVSSTEDFGIHRNCFTGFGICSFLNMFLSCVLSHWPRISKSQMECCSAKKKLYIFLANVTSFALVMYLYWRHNAYCEPYVYSFFAMFEYAVIMTNMAFHSIAIDDFGKKYIMLLEDGR